jgi:hypothetical protein
MIKNDFTSFDHSDHNQVSNQWPLLSKWISGREDDLVYERDGEYRRDRTQIFMIFYDKT